MDYPAFIRTSLPSGIFRARGKTKKMLQQGRSQGITIVRGFLHFKKNSGSVEILFFYIRLLSVADWRMTPSLPQRGKQPKGGIPLTPSFFGIYFNLIRGYRNKGDARAAGAES